jgi:methyl-accepting chemotaxis protein
MNREHIPDASQLVADVAAEVGQLSVDIADVAGDIDQVSALLNVQASRFRDIHEGATDIARSNDEIAGTASETQLAAAKARTDVETSHREVQASLAVIEKLVATVNDVGGQLAGLASAMERVGSVASDIDRIARMTNLLALNATIEAARAGAAGRGFAVVANEVNTLARETGAAAAEINSTLGTLTKEVHKLVQLSTEGSNRAALVGQSTATIGTVMRAVGDAVSEVERHADGIATATEQISARCERFVSTVADMTESVDQSHQSLQAASKRSSRILGNSESLMFKTAQSGFETIDTKFVKAAVAGAAQIEAMLAAALVNGEITIDDLFDKELKPIQGSDPQQFMTRYIPFIDRVVPPIQDPVLGIDERMVFCAVLDHNLLLPTHNPQYRKPQGRDPVWNAANCRNRRKYTDKTAAAVAASTAPFLLQTYRRDMGGGVFALMKDASAPIMVRGRHFGGLRVCYRA